MDIGLGVVAGLILLVDECVLGRGGTRGEGCVAILGDLLVGLLRCLSTGALDSLGDVVGGVL